MRTFVGFLVGFVALLLVFVAAFALQGRGAREYAARVAREATGPGACREVARGVQSPPDMTRCEVRREGGTLVVQLSLESGRTYLARR
ncbi:hypothetical protein Deima_0907 [Deinococcus maricopensis DSM 21211]|uniref:Uncharacterized protein n=1 Tax=Deinococcus maricopensis (strain DSM 21211 / LMG 22137 / NRRL B-23946 / LB-34) TaxID=709986 RepID=E8U672_DEIML|nr:hypothetical protein Deima_0907 [Deinococcus maricopensis DSM 21211]